jgi:hypothetical protein
MQWLVARATDLTPLDIKHPAVSLAWARAFTGGVIRMRDELEALEDANPKLVPK